MGTKEFRALLPVKKYLYRNIIETHPYRNDSACKSCRYRPSCETASKMLPFMILGEIEDAKILQCKKKGEMKVYRVIPYKGGPDPLKEGKSEPAASSSEGPLYLLDANILINAINKDPERGRICAWVLKTPKIRRGITQRVAGEVRDLDGRMLKRIDKTLHVEKIDAELMEIKANYGKKQPSESDLSLIQAAIDHPEVKGIISFDTDFWNIAAGGIIRSISGRKVDVLTPYDLKKKISR